MASDVVLEEVTESVTQLVDAELSLSDLAAGALEAATDSRSTTRSFAVLYGGMLYYFDVHFTAMRPPYSQITAEDAHEMGLAPDTKVWMGQREN